MQAVYPFLEELFLMFFNIIPHYTNMQLINASYITKQPSARQCKQNEGCLDLLQHSLCCFCSI